MTDRWIVLDDVDPATPCPAVLECVLAWVRLAEIGHTVPSSRVGRCRGDRHAVDYAGTRPRLLRRLITHLHRSRHRVRLLLLARSDGEWRTDPLSATPAVRRLLAAAPVIGLDPLIPRSRSSTDRRTAFTRAACDLARLLPLVSSVPAHDWAALATALQPPEDLSHPRYDNTLTLQLTALVTLLQHGPRPADTPPGAPAEKILLEHEGRFWEDSAEAPAFKLNLPTTALAATVAIAALCGATTADAATHVLGALPDLPAGKAPRTAAWLASLYPAGPDRYCGSLQPDRIAEYHASQTLTHDRIQLPALLAAATPGQQAQLVTVLARAAIAHYNAGRTTDSGHVLHTLDTALDTAVLAYRAIRSATTALPYPSRILASLALRLTGAFVQANQQLAQDNPAAYEPDLAASLSNLGNQLAAAGKRGEALTATGEAVEIYRRLAADNPAVYAPDLARSLSNLGNQLAAAGKRGQTLTATEEAVEIYRRLAADNPAVYEPDLARSLSILAIPLAEGGDLPGALRLTGEAVDLYRSHIGTMPSVLPQVHAPLGLQADLLEALGRQEEAEQVRRWIRNNPLTPDSHN
ncbi:tetratricopeptide repeat protein [Streptomyces kanasensis]|uniref:tetratricopeptide repeat protein n=1 Tax=Streptomyces kanasensis TaxID=936756 RepID=UPI0036FE6270